MGSTNSTAPDSHGSVSRDAQDGADKAAQLAQVDDIAAKLSSVKIGSDAESETPSDSDDDDGTHAPDPATVRRWEAIDRIMDIFNDRLESKMREAVPALRSFLEPDMLERRSYGQGAAGVRGAPRGTYTEVEYEEDKFKDSSEGTPKMDASIDVVPQPQSFVSAAAPPPPPGAAPHPAPAPAPVSALPKAKKSAGSSFMGLFSRRQVATSDLKASPPAGGSVLPPQPPPSQSAPPSRPLAPATSTLRTLAPAPPRATVAPVPQTHNHAGILGTLASALADVTAGGTRDLPANLPQPTAEERDRLRDELSEMYAQQTSTTSSHPSRGGLLFGTATAPFMPAGHTHSRSPQVLPTPTQRGPVHTSMPTAPLSSRGVPQASHSTWQPPSATSTSPGHGFATPGPSDHFGQQPVPDQGLQHRELGAGVPASPVSTQDGGTNLGFRNWLLPGFPQPHIHMHRNVSLQEPTPPENPSSTPPSDLADAEEADREQPGGRRRKSKVSQIKVDEEITSDHDGRRKKARKSDSANAMYEQKKFACPFFKRNKKKYSKWTSCPGPGWDEVHRVKTHLYRRHALPIQCVRCWEVFKTNELLNNHLQQNPPCESRKNQTLIEGFTKDQEKKLRSRKKAQADTTDEDKWREIYMILFPYDDVQSIPSPFYEASDYEGEGGGASSSGDLEDYATFVQREMPTLVRRELETLFENEFQEAEEPLRRRVAEIVVKLQPRLINLYKQTQMPLSDYGPPSNEPSGGGTGSEPALTPAMSHRSPDTDSTPGTNAESSIPLDFDVEDIFDFDGILGDQQTQQPHQQFDAYGNPIFDWDNDFEKLINPSLFMPPQAQETGLGTGMNLPNYYPAPSYQGPTYGSGSGSGYRY